MAEIAREAEFPPAPVVSPTHKATPVTHQLVIPMALGQAVIRLPDRQRLREFLTTLPENRPLSFLVTGRTDDQGSMASNSALALRRAMAVKKAVIAQLPNRSGNIEIEATAMCCYVAPNETRDGRIRNRRAEIIVTEGL